MKLSSLRHAPTLDMWGAHIVQAFDEGNSKRIAKRMVKTMAHFQLVEPDDQILVAVSGGKDSYTLLEMLWAAKNTAPFPFEIVAVHLDQVQPDYDGKPLLDWLKASGIPFEFLQRDTYTQVMEFTKEGGTTCSMCSRLRRGTLYDAAARLKCNKLALGHHSDDSLETYWMNAAYGGRLAAMPARYRTDDDRFTVIRPLIEVLEKDIALHAERAEYPILPCNLCGSQSGLKRQETKALLTELDERIPGFRANLAKALKNVDPTHLLDEDLRHAWQVRPEEIQPRPTQSARAGASADVLHKQGLPKNSNSLLQIL